MRVGMSWRVGRGRRQWVSMGPVGWIFLGPFLLAWYMIAWSAWLMVMFFVWSYQGIAWTVRTLRRLRNDRRATRN